MASSSALEALVACAQAIQDGNPELADSLLKGILKLADEEPDVQRSRLLRYFAEALVRRAYGLHPATTYSTAQLNFITDDYCFNGSVRDAINNAVRRKKRLHLIDFYIPHLYGCHFFSRKLPRRSSDNPVSVRVSVILPPILEKIVNFQQEKEFLTAAAKIFGVEFEKLEVIYANNLGEVDDASMLEFRRTEDEAVVIFYHYKFQTLLVEAGAMEREFSKLRQIIPDIVIMREQNADLNNSNFIQRLEKSFQYYSQCFRLEDEMFCPTFKNYYRKQIGYIIGCEGRDRKVRPQTLAQWRSRLTSAGFLPVPLKLEDNFFPPRCGIVQEDSGCVVLTDENHTISFVSAWKPGDEEHQYPNTINNDFVQAKGFSSTPPVEDTLQPLRLLPEGSSLNRFAALVEIYDMVEDICLKYELPSALTWTCEDYEIRTPNKITSNPYDKYILKIENSCCYPTKVNLSNHGELGSSKYYFLRERPVVEEVLKSKKPFIFQRITRNHKQYDRLFKFPKFGPYAIVAARLQNRRDEIYIVEFFLLYEEERMKQKSLARDIFNDLENMKKMFVTLRVEEIKFGFQEEAISNIPQGEPREGHDVLGIKRPTEQGIVLLNFQAPLDIDAPAPPLVGRDLLTTPNPMNYNGVLETPRIHEQVGVISNFNPLLLPMHASSSAGTGFLTTPKPMSYHGVLEATKPDEQGSEKQSTFEAPASNDNEMGKADASNLQNSISKRRKLTSNVWEEFTKKKEEDGKEWAICAYCARKFDGSSKKGTTHLRKHLERCKSRPVKVRDQIFSVGIGDLKIESIGLGNSSFDQERSSMDFARMIIEHQFSLNIVDYKYFGIFLKNLQPMFKLQSQEALSADIIRVYKEEKHKLFKHFDKLSCHFSLTISVCENDLEKTCCYVVHFVDENWKLKKRILALKNFGLEFDINFFHENLKSVLMDWNFGKKVCSLIINSSSSSFEVAEEIRKIWLSFETSDLWSTFLINSDECIHGFLSKDNVGENDFSMFQNVGKSIDGVIGTSNPCLVAILDIYKRLSQYERRDYPLMNVKADDYNWRTSSLVIAIATILDPRFKFEFVEFSYNTLYRNHEAEIHLTVIRNGLIDIFNEYARDMNNGTFLFDDTNSLTSLNVEESTIKSFRSWNNSKRNVNTMASWKSELHKYLQEDIVSSKEEFDLLTWWSEHASRFPTLGRMARDILAIPMSSIISGSTFNEKSMMDNPIFNGLNPEIIEAMICSRDWLESPKDCYSIVKSKNSSSLAHHLESEDFFSASDNEAPRTGDLGSEATTWTEKEVRAYLLSPFAKEELECLNKWTTHIINGEYIESDKISGSALAPLLMIPPSDVDLRDPQNYYIDDTVVDQFFILLKQRYERFPHKYLKHHSFNSFIASFLINGSKTESQVLNWVKQEDLKGVSKLFLPICLRKHWLLFYADIEGKKLVWLDSNEHSQMSNVLEKQVILRWFLEFLLPSLGYDQKDWSFDVPKDIPLQKNSVDCALFMMKYADCLTHGNYFPFDQNDMSHFRRRTFLDLYHGSVCLG